MSGAHAQEQTAPTTRERVLAACYTPDSLGTPSIAAVTGRDRPLTAVCPRSGPRDRPASLTEPAPARPQVLGTYACRNSRNTRLNAAGLSWLAQCPAPGMTS